ncbi:MAG: endonuclease MutS2 [Chloroflexi bacterium]|nr:endonuclease MutS2 [Chloroflexota bacterium]
MSVTRPDESAASARTPPQTEADPATAGLPVVDPRVVAPPRFSLGPLEFQKIRELLAARTSFSAGRALALALEPSADAFVVERLQAATDEARRLPGLKPGLTLGGAHDVRPTVQRAALGGILQPVELLDVASTARVSRHWRSTLLRLRETFPALANVANRLSDLQRLEEQIGHAIESGGEVADDASPKLHQLRRDLRVAQDRLLNQLQSMLHVMRASLTDAVITQRNGRYVLPVRADERNRVRGIVHDQSASGQTLFIEPMPIVEAGNRVRQLEAEERHEVERILRDLSGLVAIQRDDLDGSVEALAELDLHLAKGRLGDEMDATRPVLNTLPRRSTDQPIVRLEQARHPLLRGTVVPLTIELGGAFDVLVITGPNTGGKTVALKTVGLLALMAQAGLQIPAAEGSELAIFERVFADIGDEQSIEQSLSTFSSHVTHIVEMLDFVHDRGLVLLDELGAGTDPQEGSALARAILIFLRDRGAFTIATTHYSELKAFAHSTPRVANASVEFDVRTLAPTYRLLVGVPGRSNALAIAGRLGMPPEVLEQARELLSPETIQAEELLGEIQRERRNAEAARRDARREAAEADKLRRRLRDELRRTEQERQEILRHARDESERLLADLRREAARRMQELAAAGADRRRLRDAAATLDTLQPLPRPEARSIPSALALPAPNAPDEAASEEAASEDAGPADVRVGAEVIVPRIGMSATIVSLAPNGDAELNVRGLRVRVKASELAEARRATRKERQETQRLDALRDEPPLLERPATAPVAPSTQLDLRGLRRDEAADVLDRYLNDAYLAGLRSVRIIHGKGSGAVRAAVREQLAGHPLVSRFNAADPREGGEGATEVTLA